MSPLTLGGIRRLSYTQLQFGLATLLDALTGPTLRFDTAIYDVLEHYIKSAASNQVLRYEELIRERMGSFLIPAVNDAERQTIGQENNRHGLSPLLHR